MTTSTLLKCANIPNLGLRYNAFSVFHQFDNRKYRNLNLNETVQVSVSFRLQRPVSTSSHLPKERNYDAVIIGGGHNGLVAAAYLAKSGLK